MACSWTTGWCRSELRSLASTGSIERDLSQLSGLDLVDKPADLFVGDERVGSDPRSGLLHIVVGLWKRLESEAGAYAGVGEDLVLDGVVCEGLHPAVCVVDE